MATITKMTKRFFGFILSLVVLALAILSGDALTVALAGGASYALVPTFQSIDSLKEFAKSYSSNSSGVTDLTALTDGAALTMHNIDEMMILTAQDTNDYKFLNTMFYKDTKSTLNIYARILDWGGNGDFSFLGESDDAEFKDVIIDRISKNVAFLAEGYAISKVLDISNTGSFDPEAIQVEGAVNRIMRTLAYKNWYGNKAINSLEFSGFATELIDQGQVYDARGGFPAIADLKELTIEVRQAWGMVNDFWLHPASKQVLDNYYVGSKEFVIPNTPNPNIGFNIPGMYGAELQNDRLEFKTDMWLNRHQVELPTYRDANNAKVSGKTNEKAPDAPSAIAVVTGVVAGSKWSANDIKNSAGAAAKTNYKIVACNRYGRSATSATVETDAVLVALASVTVTITPAGSGQAATYFEIFRENIPSSGKFYLTERIVKAGTPTTVYTDMNEWRPGCSDGVIGDFNSRSPLDKTRTYQFLRMLPMVQTKFPPNAVYQRKYAGMVEFYGALAILQPRRFWFIKNLPTGIATTAV